MYLFRKSSEGIVFFLKKFFVIYTQWEDSEIDKISKSWYALMFAEHIELSDQMCDGFIDVNDRTLKGQVKNYKRIGRVKF